MAAPSNNASLNITVADGTVNLLRDKDRASSDRVDRAEAIRQQLVSMLKENFKATTKDATHLLNCEINIASEGSRLGRFMAAEMGVGLAKLRVTWELLERDDSKGSFVTKVNGSTLFETSSAGCGAADICQSDAGDRALDIMTQRIAIQIHKAATNTTPSNPTKTV